MYHDHLGREIEDLEGDNMRRDALEAKMQDYVVIHVVQLVLDPDHVLVCLPVRASSEAGALEKASKVPYMGHVTDTYVVALADMVKYKGGVVTTKPIKPEEPDDGDVQ